MFAPIAIVGTAALFAGSAEPDGFWRNILAGTDLVTDVPATHWLIEDYYDADPSAPQKTYAKRGSFLPEIPFDPMENGITPVNLRTTDPSQLLGVVVARRALEDACGPELGKLDRKRTCVILGVGGATEAITQMSGALQRPLVERTLRDAGLAAGLVTALGDRLEALYTPWNENTFPGMLPNVVAGRIANRFDLGGANFTTDAACASSLAALKMAVSELALGEADLAITGGVDALNTVLMYLCFSKTPAMSKSGVCRPFSEGSDGTLMGEGAALFALKRLADAERDGDPVYAVLRGIGASSDGRAKSIYAPSSPGQAEALRRAYAGAGYSPATVELVEAHGTATVAGDAAEFAALKEVFAESRAADEPWCALGSVKSQIGHTKGAAGAASLYKAVMALHNGVLPPMINVVRPNPALGIAGSPFALNTERRPWIRGAEHPRRASVSSFGFGGSNFHCTLEEYAGPRPARIRALDTELLLFAADDARALRASADAACAASATSRGFVHAARASQQRFSAGAPFRLALVARDGADLAAKVGVAFARIAAAPCRAFADGDGAFASGAASPGPVGFLFPGQGSQYVQMGRDAAIAFPAARAAWDAAASDPAPVYEALARRVFAPAAFADDERAAQTERLRATDVAQPAIGIASLAYLRLLDAVGVVPAAAAGHSFGEVTALHAAGVLDEATFRAVARLRGAAMAEVSRTTPGAMLAVFAPATAIADALAAEPEVVVANDNAPRQIVLSGPTDAIARIAPRIAAAAVTARPLDVATAFHSPIVAGAVEPFAAALATLPFGDARFPVFGSAAAVPYPAQADAVRETLATQLREPVRFTAQIEALYAAGVRTFLEVGPNRVLTGLAAQTLGDRPHRALALDDKRGGLGAFWLALGALAVDGVAIDTAPLWDGYDSAAPVAPRRSAATVAITGTAYGKPYPPAPGTRAPAPLPELVAAPAPAAVAPTPPPAITVLPPASTPNAPGKTIMQPSDDATRADLFAMYRQASEAHVASQEIWARTHHAFLEMTRAAFAGIDSAPRAESAEPRMLAPHPASASGMPAAPTTPSSPSPAAAANGAYRNGASTNGAAAAYAAPIPGAPLASSPAAPVPVAPVTPTSAPIQAASPAPVFATASAPTAPPAAASGRDELVALMRDVVSQKTGYPVTMIELDMELEADLGIDSIKRVEILSAFRAAAPHLPEVDPRELAAMDTLGAIVDRLAPALAGPSPVAASVSAVAPAFAPAPAGERDLAAILFAVVAEKTGYPTTMLEPAMELEADLGIDSIKRVEILSAFRAAVPDLPEVDPRELASLQTLAEILTRLGGAADAATDEPVLVRLGRTAGQREVDGVATAGFP